MVYNSGNQRDIERELKQVGAKIQLKKNQIKLLEVQKEVLEDKLKIFMKNIPKGFLGNSLVKGLAEKIF